MITVSLLLLQLLLVLKGFWLGPLDVRCSLDVHQLTLSGRMLAIEDERISIFIIYENIINGIMLLHSE